jgi:hypothetical protein
LRAAVPFVPSNKSLRFSSLPPLAWLEATSRVRGSKAVSIAPAVGPETSSPTAYLFVPGVLTWFLFFPRPDFESVSETTSY